MFEQMGEIDIKYNKIVKVSIYFSIWLLSFMVLYIYLKKHQSTVEYNKLISKMNTKKLMDQVKRYNEKCKVYYSLAFPSNVMDKEQELNISGLMEAKKDLYKELIKTIELYDKCNYIRTTSGDSPFPYNEVMISIILLSIVVGIIVISNIQNNPFNVVGKSAKLKSIGKSISELNLFNNIQKGGADNVYQNNSNVLNLLNKKQLQIKTDLQLLKSNMTFNYILVAISIILFTVFIVYKMFSNAINYGENLYSGRLFMKSRCYKF